MKVKQFKRQECLDCKSNKLSCPAHVMNKLLSGVRVQAYCGVVLTQWRHPLKSQTVCANCLKKVPKRYR